MMTWTAYKERLATVSTQEITDLGETLKAEQNLIAVNACLMWLKVFKYLVVTKRLSRLTRTLSRAFGEIVSFFIVYLCALMGFAFGFTVAMGSDVVDFCSLTASMASLMRAAFGDFDYTSVQVRYLNT